MDCAYAMLTNISLDISPESHALANPNLHDGLLLGILTSDKIVDLIVADIEKRKYQIKLHDIVILYATQFKEGNSILDVTIARGSEVRADDLSLLHSSDLAPNAQYMEKLLERIGKELLFVLQVSPSYGCELLAIAKNITMQKM
jgi:hypothetical protein